jgi:tRNA pseudouridine55 synthase
MSIAAERKSALIKEHARGKGTYIRSLARDIAVALGTVGHIVALRRTACGPFTEAKSISLESLSLVGQGPTLRSCLLPIETALDDIPALALTEADARRLQSGGPVPLARAAFSHPQAEIAQGIPCRAMVGERLVALVRIEGDLIRPVRVMTLDQSEGADDVDHP